VIEFRDLSFRYHKDRMILQDLSSSVPGGKITALLGPNGTGKTTLIYCALGWLRPLRGDIFINGKDIQDFSRNELSRTLALVPQQETIPFPLRVIDYALFGRAPYLKPLESPGKDDYQIAREMLKRLSIKYMENWSVRELSGGEKQLVLIARALTQQPECLLLDEPTTHLDPANRHRILRIMKSLAESGKTIFFTTHSPEEALSVAGHCMFLNNRTIVSQGKTEDILTSENLTELYGIHAEIEDTEKGRTLLWPL